MLWRHILPAFSKKIVGKVRQQLKSPSQSFGWFPKHNFVATAENSNSNCEPFFVQQSLPESDAYILERIGKASEWFQDKFSLIFDDLSQKFQMETDNKELGKKIDNALNNLKQEILAKLARIKSCERGFSPLHYLRSISKAEVAFSPEKGKNPKPQFTASQTLNTRNCFGI